QKIIGGVADLCFNRAEVVVIVRDVDLALRAEEIFFPNDFELFEFEGVRFEIYFRGEAIDLPFEKRERVAAGGQESAEFSLTGIERSFDRDRAGEVARLRSEQLRELAEVA